MDAQEVFVQIRTYMYNNYKLYQHNYTSLCGIRSLEHTQKTSWN